jgi:hypothetical protein
MHLEKLKELIKTTHLEKLKELIIIWNGDVVLYIDV